jgi:hypothetical protein
MKIYFQIRSDNENTYPDSELGVHYHEGSDLIHIKIDERIVGIRSSEFFRVISNLKESE